MKLRCPHCMKVIELAEADTRGFFMTCKECGKRFRMNETSPLTGMQSAKAADMQALEASKGKGLEARPIDFRVVARINSRGADLFRQGKLRDAEKELRKSLQMNPEQPRIVRMLDEIERALLTVR